MAEFSRFSELPKELQLQIWEAAIPQSPSVHFLSYPPKDRHKRRAYQWRGELANANRTINVDKDPDTGEPSIRARTWGRYSSYFASLALLHACQESRRVCLAHTPSSEAHDSDAHGVDSSNIVSTDSYNLNLATDIICVQDPDPHFPWSQPRRLSLLPRLDPVRIALERRPYLDCNEMGNWITELSGGIDGDYDCATSLGNEDGDPGLKMIYLLDYDMKPKHAIVAGTSQTNHDGTKPPNESESESDDRSAVKLPGHTSTHNGRFHGHGVKCYALSANIKETCAGWVVPQESRDFHSDVCFHIQHRYGFAVVHSLEEAKKGEYMICVEFLACVKA
ncbi:hypothetical protein INS49_015376 [Diaporthe citri]|uniref:uncharacterized protein n=1 Tax=Diaporthe citri TaxID=83186 RepID=UPI001C7EB166|nr:uncharacterized protein INS49_015376 [Diaporthe citri]KAG6355991.1 hypothetical protein INS49_015376 [Diaporthe citri]